MTNLQEQGASSRKPEMDLLTILHLSLIFFVVIHLFYFIFILIKQNLQKKKKVQPQKPETLRKINDSCSICLDELQCEVQMLCSHSYCAACIIGYGKQRYNYSEIQCPICRADSKLMFASFERTEENKELYDQILHYNHECTSHYPSSFCFSLDMYRLCQIYFKQLTNFENPRFESHRKSLIFLTVAAFVLVIYSFAHKFDSLLQIVEDVVFYLFVIVACAEYFYKRIRNQSNLEYGTLPQMNTEISNVEVTQITPVE
jgi:phosphatidylglycerophosphate synthase